MMNVSLPLALSAAVVAVNSAMAGLSGTVGAPSVMMSIRFFRPGGLWSSVSWHSDIAPARLVFPPVYLSLLNVLMACLHESRVLAVDTSVPKCTIEKSWSVGSVPRLVSRSLENWSMFAKFGQHMVGRSPPELHDAAGSQSRQRLLVHPLQTDPLMSIAMQRLKSPFTSQVGWRVGDSVGFLVGFVGVGSAVGLAVGLAEGDLVGTLEGALVGLLEGALVGLLEGVVDGSRVGSSVGPSEGDPVGCLVGVAEGSRVGPSVGSSEGDLVGSVVGSLEGDSDGPFVGSLDGDFEGLTVGPLEGSLEGVIVGTFDGLFEGLTVGSLEGDFDGLFVGSLDGDFEGLAVG